MILAYVGAPTNTIGFLLLCAAVLLIALLFVVGDGLMRLRGRGDNDNDNDAKDRCDRVVPRPSSSKNGNVVGENSGATAAATGQSRRSADDDESWLLGPGGKADCDLRRVGEGGLTVRCRNSATLEEEWTLGDRIDPPPLRRDGVSYFYGVLGPSVTERIFGATDIVVRPEPVTIAGASPGEVWDVLLDFPRYGEWNPFHRGVEVVETEKKRKRALRMTVDLGPVVGCIVSEETIYYADAKRHILIYGIGKEGPACMRAIWLTTATTTTTVDMDDAGVSSKERRREATIFHSWDLIGGYPAWFSKGHIERCVLRGFTAQHRSLRLRLKQLRLLKRLEAGPGPAGTLLSSQAPQNKKCALGVCLVTGGTGFLGSHLARMLCGLPDTSVHVVDINGRDASKSSIPDNVTIHTLSICDDSALQTLFREIQPNVVFHVAAKIDLRPGVQSGLREVNVDATSSLLRHAKAQRCCRAFVYTSSIECAGWYNRCENAVEALTPYAAHPTNGYQETKIDAEMAVQTADDNDNDDDDDDDGGGMQQHNNNLKTVCIRSGHIYGTPFEDVLGGLFRLGDVPACFSEKSLCCGGVPAKMSMVHVENCALAHVLAALRIDSAHGLVFHVEDFAMNIVSVYRDVEGKDPPAAPIVLPYWVLLFLVRCACLLHVVVSFFTRGRLSLLQPMTGLHDGASQAGLEYTLDGSLARRVLGYRPVATLAACRNQTETARRRTAGASSSSSSSGTAASKRHHGVSPAEPLISCEAVPGLVDEALRRCGALPDDE